MFFLGLLLSSLIMIGACSLADHCNENKDCQVKDAICQQQSCRCDDLYYLKELECLPYVTEYKGYCKEKQQCEWLGENSDCIKNRCVCEKGNRWFRGKCRKYVGKGENCSENVDCYDGQDLLSLSCNSGKCVCNSTYYDRGGDCRRKSHLWKDCALNQDCSLIEHCKRGKCKILNDANSAVAANEIAASFIPMSNKFYEDLSAVAANEIAASFVPMSNKFYDDFSDTVSCQFDDNCTYIINSLCNSKTHKCGCPENTYLDRGICIPGLQSCKDEVDCANMNNTMCFKQRTCICKPSYFLRDGKCIPELGVKDVIYKSEKDCQIKPALFHDNICYCKHYWFTDDGNRNCIKTMTAEFGNCLTNDWCKVMGPYSYCDSTTGKCKCSINAKLNEKTYYCEKISELDDSFCINDYDCTNINQQCLNQKCQCVEKFYKNKDGDCVPGIEGSCSHNLCTLPSGCLEGLCQCGTNYIKYGNNCLKDADKYGDQCEVDLQCRNVPFTSCSLKHNSTERVCSCIDDYIEIERKCWKTKSYGDPCMTKEECTTVLNKSYLCRNNRCQCPVGEKLKNGYCSGATSFVYETRLLRLSIFLMSIFQLVSMKITMSLS